MGDSSPFFTVRLPQGQGPGLRVMEALAGSLPAHPRGSPIPAQPVPPSPVPSYFLSPFPFSGIPGSVPFLTVHYLLLEKALCPLPMGLMIKLKSPPQSGVCSEGTWAGLEPLSNLAPSSFNLVS